MANAARRVKDRDGVGAEARLDELVTALITASRALVGVSARSLAEVEGTVTITQFRTLVVLGNCDGLNLSALAEQLDVNASSAVRMIDRPATRGGARDAKGEPGQPARGAARPNRGGAPVG